MQQIVVRRSERSGDGAPLVIRSARAGLCGNLKSDNMALQDLTPIFIRVAFPLGGSGKSGGEDTAVPVIRKPGEVARGVGMPGTAFQEGGFSANADSKSIAVVICVFLSTF